MFIISCGIVVLLIVLAVISRNNFSKYKGKEGGWLLIIFGSMAEWIEEHTDMRILKKYIEPFVRKLNAVSENELANIVDEFVVKMIRNILIGIGVTALLSITVMAKETYFGNKNITISRPGYGEYDADYEIGLEFLDEKRNFSLTIYPREYDYETFEEEADRTEVYLEGIILGENPSLSEVSHNLNLVSEDEKGVMKVNWESEKPTVISPNGEVTSQGTGETEVLLTAVITDGKYKRSKTWNVVVIPTNAGPGEFENAINGLIQIEGNDRTAEYIELPESLNGVKITNDAPSPDIKGMYILIFGIICSLLLGLAGISRLKEEANARKKEFEKYFFCFVNKLCLMVGAGMTINSSLKELTKMGENSSIIAEIRICLNEIESGVTESKAYVNLGLRIGSDPYIRLCEILSLNSSYGNKGIIEMLEQETKNYNYYVKEKTRKLGEEASSKLVIPLLFLMGLVILIVMIPAMVNFM